MGVRVGILSDGRIVLGGYAWDGAQDNFAAARFKRRGALDRTFSGDGRRIVNLGGLQGWAMALQPDGKILLAGNLSTVVRLKVGGGLDPTFSKDGIRTVDFGASTRLRGIALQPDGKIVVVGRAFIGNGDFAVARLKSNGALDKTFSKDGTRVTDLGGVDEAHASRSSLTARSSSQGSPTAWISISRWPGTNPAARSTGPSARTGRS